MTRRQMFSIPRARVHACAHDARRAGPGVTTRHLGGFSLNPSRPNGYGSFHEPRRNAGPKAQRMHETPDFPGFRLLFLFLFIGEGMGAQISTTLSAGPARGSKFVAAEIGGRGYRISTALRAGPARSSCARPRNEKIFFSRSFFPQRATFALRAENLKTRTESNQSLKGVSEFAAKFRRGESPRRSLHCDLGGSP